jgi:hypothetical protein
MSIESRCICDVCKKKTEFKDYRMSHKPDDWFRIGKDESCTALTACSVECAKKAVDEIDGWTNHG